MTDAPRPTVYVVQEPGPARDFDSVTAYGDLHFVLPRNSRPSFAPDLVLRDLRSRLADFTTRDYIVWAGGDPLASILAGIVLRELGHSTVQYLRWERHLNPDGSRSSQGYYVPGRFNLHNNDNTTSK